MRAEAPARRTASHLHQLSDARADGRVTFLALSYRPVPHAQAATNPAYQLLKPACYGS